MKIEQRTRPRRPPLLRLPPLEEVTLDEHDVARLPWEPLGQTGLVRYRSLWVEPRSRSAAGLLRLDPGATVARHTHGSAVHHIWVADGCCTVAGRHLGKGSYAFVPPGASHGIDWAGPEGCTLLYLYLRTDTERS